MSAAGELDKHMAALLKRHGLDTVEGALAYGGGRDLTKAGLGSRRRTRLELADEAGAVHVVYLKRYGPQGLLARLRRRWGTGRWCSPAEAEFRSVRAAREAGLTSMRELAWGAESACCGRSYLVLSAVRGQALERCGEAFWDRMVRDEAAGAALAAALADLVREMHVRGFVHRDLYASHVFAEDRAGRLELGLIDLARMFRPRTRLLRWRVKDLSALHHSLPREWVGKWWDAFLRRYLGESPVAAVERWRKAIGRKAGRITRRAARTQASKPRSSAGETPVVPEDE